MFEKLWAYMQKRKYKRVKKKQYDVFVRECGKFFEDRSEQYVLISWKEGTTEGVKITGNTATKAVAKGALTHAAVMLASEAQEPEGERTLH